MRPTENICSSLSQSTENHWNILTDFTFSNFIKTVTDDRTSYHRRSLETAIQFHSTNCCIVWVIIYDSKSLQHNSKIIWSHDVLWESIELLRTNLKDQNGRQLGSPKLLWYRRKNVFEDANGTDASCISFKIGSLLPPSGYLCRVLLYLTKRVSILSLYSIHFSAFLAYCSIIKFQHNWGDFLKSF